ncbi:porin [Rhodopseudomonas pseudopalustris]|uniref:Porin n=2 Tax=Rhodopseudomonas TaxID=1073 RepID=Q13EC8_RHOPS|nr:porin [Rhodopseudomonas pseudopalustris]ABE37561.1 putative Omp2b porin [Rhodopseudomonas palustris BisB5]SEP38297.1 Porin subfamily protein [Rhodopseudomonas pseudopalustris]
MNSIKRLALGSAAALFAIGSAQAADLPLKAKAVEYVKICSIYGAGFYYIPGTDTCIKLGGYVRADVTFNGSNAYDAPAWNGASGAKNRNANSYIFRSRQDINVDTRTATEYGVVRTYFDAVFSWTTGGANSGIAGGELGVYYAFVQFAGFTFGKAVSQFDTPWTGYPGNNTSYLIGGYDNVTGINQVAYTSEFGNGVSASVSLEDQSAYLQSNLYNTNVGGTVLGYGANSYAGTSVPDIVGKIRVDQAWGLFQVSAAAHQVRASYYTPALETSGHPGDTWGYAVQGALSLKNLPTGPGDSINITATYSNGATRYVIGGVTTPASFLIYDNGSIPGTYQSVAFAHAADGVFAGANNVFGTGIEKTNAWGVRGAFNHNWSPYWSSSLFGSYTSIDYNGNASALICAGLGAPVAGFNCNPDFRIAQVGTVTRWTPVKNLTFSGEVLYTYLDQSHTGVVNVSAIPALGKPTANYELKDQGVWTGSLRVQRTF